MARLQELLSIKEDFGSMIDRVQPWILSHFIMWLDLKIAEYKVYGYMLLDDSVGDVTARSAGSPDQSPILRSTSRPCRRQLSSDGNLTVVPTPPSPNNIQGSINRRNVAEKDGHYQTLNSLFLKTFPNKQVVERSANTLQRPEMPTPETSMVHKDWHPQISVVNTAQPHGKSEMYMGFSTSHDNNMSLDNNMDQRTAERPASDNGLKYGSISSPDSSQSLSQKSTDSYRGSSAMVAKSRNKDNDGGFTALYKSQQFSTLISDSRPQKLDHIDKWNGSDNHNTSSDIEEFQTDLLKDVTVIDLATGCSGQPSHTSTDNNYCPNNDNTLSVNAVRDMGDSQTTQQSPKENKLCGTEADSKSATTLEHTAEGPHQKTSHYTDMRSHYTDIRANQSFHFHNAEHQAGIGTGSNAPPKAAVIEITELEQSQELDTNNQSKEEKSEPFSPVVIKIESDNEDFMQHVPDTGQVPTGVTAPDESSSDVTNFKSFYMDDGSLLPMATSSNSGMVVPVELIPHGNFPSVSVDDVNLSVSEGSYTRKRRYIRTKPFASSPSCLPRDPITGKFICVICNGKFQNRSSYFRHKSLHGEKRLQCFVCMKRFHRKEHASMHMNRHCKIGELICPICRYSGSGTVDMEEHFFHVHKIRSMYTYKMYSDNRSTNSEDGS